MKPAGNFKTKELAKLHRCFQKGLSPVRIARLLDRPVRSIINEIKRQKLII